MAWRGGAPPKPPDARSYAQATLTHNIVKEYHEEILNAKKTRNKIEIKFFKQGERTPGSKYIDLDTVADYVFDTLGIDYHDVDSVDFTNSNSGTKIINFKPTVKTEKYLASFADFFNGYSVSISHRTHQATRVTFKNVPKRQKMQFHASGPVNGQLRCPLHIYM